MKHVLSVLVDNHPGVLRRVSGLFGRRGYNIDSLVVSATENEEISRMTIVVCGDESVIDQVSKQLAKLIDVISVEDVTGKETVSKQLLLLKIKADISNRIDIITLAEAFNARVEDIAAGFIIIEATDEINRISNIIETFKPYGILELVKTGTVAMTR
jgi:acetolactate synthase I/III small subunit